MSHRDKFQNGAAQLTEAIESKGNSMTLNQEQIDFFWEHGYLKIGKVLTDTEIETYRAEYDRVFEEGNRTNNYSNLASDNKSADSKRTAQKQMLQIVNMCERSIVFGKLNSTIAFSTSSRI